MLRLLLVLLLPWPGIAMAALLGNLLAGTPPSNLGAPGGRLPQCPDKPNCVSSQATDDDHRIAPFTYRDDRAAALARLARIVKASDGTIVTQRDGYLYATFQTPIMGFVDDVEFVAAPAGGAIDVRSASRLGHSDLGVNRKRVEKLRTAFAEAAP